MYTLNLPRHAQSVATAATANSKTHIYLLLQQRSANAAAVWVPPPHAADQRRRFARRAGPIGVRFRRAFAVLFENEGARRRRQIYEQCVDDQMDYQSHGGLKEEGRRGVNSRASLSPLLKDTKLKKS